ncbi:unnamed protein product [Schistocephalus solidus]|uniref:LAGLIDADG_2 domain-containing protein n=1 Tax=Schistocephalus solidus TaxID=70667 RepID=A0A183TLY1_SCHSO|nr:unnamed protein product [Schistocephalus solidus]
MDLAISPVTACFYVVDCPVDLVPAFYAVGSHGKRAASSAFSVPCATGPPSVVGSRGPQDQPAPNSLDAFSSRKWPINGGEWGSNLCSYQELIITGDEFVLSQVLSQFLPYGERYLPHRRSETACSVQCEIYVRQSFHATAVQRAIIELLQDYGLCAPAGFANSRQRRSIILVLYSRVEHLQTQPP